MNRFRLIDEVSVYLLDRNNCHITLLYQGKGRSFGWKKSRPILLIEWKILQCKKIVAKLNDK